MLLAPPRSSILSHARKESLTFLSSRLFSCSSFQRNRDLESAKSHINPGIGRISSLIIESGKGSFLYTSDGRKILDFTSGIGVTSTGHSHPRIISAVTEQLSKVAHAQINIAYHAPMLKLVKELLPIVPRGLDNFFFWNSGSEAVEASIKVARSATKKQNIIVFQGGFHGRTYGAMALTTSKNVYMTGFGPLMPGVFVCPYPYSSQLPKGMTEEERQDYCLAQFERILHQQTSPSDTAAALLEPILGEGGYVIPPPSFLKKLKRICEENNILLIADEVQSGFGRTGRYFAVEHFELVPDILVMAKGIASGFPLSAIVTRSDLVKNLSPGSMGGTYAGNAISCAAALATLEVFQKEDVLGNVQKRGKQLKDGLITLSKRYPVKEVRGLGLMLALEFDEKVPSGTASKISKKLVDHDLFLLTCSIFETLRFIPPLIVKEEEIDLGLEKLERGLKEVFGK